METNTLKLEKRSETGRGKGGRLREQGLIPAIVYRKDMPPTFASVNASKLREFIRHMGGMPFFKWNLPRNTTFRY